MLLSWTDAEGIRPPPSWGWVRHRPRLRQCRWRRSFPIKGVVPACLSTGSLPPLSFGPWASGPGAPPRTAGAMVELPTRRADRES